MRHTDALLDALSSTPADGARVVAPLAAAAAAARPAPHEWAVVEIVAHLFDVERRYQDRLRRVQEEDRPLLPRIDPAARGYDRRQGSALLADRFAEAWPTWRSWSRPATWFPSREETSHERRR